MRPGWIASAGAVIALARVAAAAEEGHAHGGGIPVATLLFSTVNLAMFVAIIARYALPPVRVWARERRARVIAALNTAAAERDEALRLRTEWDARIAQLDRAIERMREQAQRDAELERQRILAAAQKTAEAMRRDAERAAAYEQRRVYEQLRAELVRRAIEQAEETVRSRWTETDQARSVSELLQQVQR